MAKKRNREEEILDEVLKDALNVLRLSAGERRRVLKRLSEIEAVLLRRINEEDLSAATRAKMKRVLTHASLAIDTGYQKLQKELDFEGIGRTVVTTTADSLEVVLGVEALAMPAESYLKSLASEVMVQGAPSADWWRGQSEKLKLDFASQMRLGLASGETNQQLIARVTGKGGVPGIMDTARRNAAALVQTSVQTVANDARRATFDANPDVIKGLRQVSTLDSHTSLVCVSYSGAAWDLKRKPIEGNTLPYQTGVPRHWNCRSVEVPITKTFRELGLDIDEPTPTTRASADGQIDAKTSFDGFLKRIGPVRQDEILGVGRADLWRSGKITTRDLVSMEGNPLTLTQLRAIVGKDFLAANYGKRYTDESVTPESVLESFPKITKELMVKTNQKLAALTDTSVLHTVNGKYTPERLKLHDKILFDPEKGILSKAAVKRATPAEGETPTMIILGGRGGSGKSSLNGKEFPQAKVYDDKKTLVLNNDDIKEMLPEFKGFNANQVHDESSFILERIIEAARAKKLNIVIDGTLKSGPRTIGYIDSFKGSGYRLEAHYMFLPKQEAAKRAVSRFLTKNNDGSGRYVPPEIIMSNTNNEKNFDDIRKAVDFWSFRDNNVERGEPPRLIAQGGKPK